MNLEVYVNPNMMRNLLEKKGREVVCLKMKDKTTFSYIKNYCGQRNPVHWYSD